MNVLKTANALVQKAESVSSLPLGQRTAEKLILFGELLELLRSLTAYHEGFATAAQTATEQVTELVSCFYEVRPGVWLALPGKNALYRDSLNRLCDAVSQIKAGTQ